MKVNNRLEIYPKCVNNVCMKKLVCILILFCFVSPALAEIQAPSWSEFCPREYLHAEYIKDNTMPGWLNTLVFYTIIGIPIANWDMNKYNEIQENNYWVDRRNQFNNEIIQCKNVINENELIYRYLTIRQNEISKNQNLKLADINQAQANLSNKIQRVDNLVRWNY